MPQYLLPCSCGQKVRVEPAQAGGLVACSCGRQLTVPTLRGLKQLESAPPSKTNSQLASRRWGPIQGALFSIGVLVAVVSLLVVGYSFWQYVRVMPFTTDRTDDINLLEEQQIADMDLMQSIAAFENLQTAGLPEENRPLWIDAQEFARKQRTLMIWFGIFAALGSIAVIVSLLFRSGQ